MSGDITWPDFHERMNLLAEATGEWSGIPRPLDDFDLILEPTHTLAPYFAGRAIERNLPKEDIEVGGHSYRVRNCWHSRQKQAMVYIVEEEGDNGAKISALVLPKSPDRSMDRLTYALRTLGASRAWDLKAEMVAREKLRGLVTELQWHYYECTGSFIESSDRSRVMYLFRKGRSTIAMVAPPPGKDDHMRMLASLCMHPIGYYAGTFAGAMTPTDDVISHLMLMRHDEPMLWRRATQHAADTPEAGL